MPYKVYLSGPMTGYENNNRLAFDMVKKYLSAKRPDWIIISPAELDDLLGEPVGHREAMARDLVIVCQCDCIYMMGGWEKSKGAIAEFATALACELEIAFERDASCVREIIIEAKNKIDELLNE